MTARQQQERAKVAIFKIPPTAWMAVGFLVLCMTPVALGGVGWLAIIYLVPIGLLVFVGRTRTVADENGLLVRTMFGQRELPWSALKGLALTDKAKVRAVLVDDSQVPLPTVRTRHLPVLALVSGGRLPDPTGLTSTRVENPSAKNPESPRTE